MNQPAGKRTVVEPGCAVEVEFVYEGGEREIQVLSLVPDEEADFLQGLLGVGTLMAKALMGYPEGERVFYRQADLLEVRILKIVPGGGKRGEGVAERREENLRKAQHHAELGNAIAFAASFSGKWGDYDPSKLTEEWEEKKPEEPGEEAPTDLD